MPRRPSGLRLLLAAVLCLAAAVVPRSAAAFALDPPPPSLDSIGSYAQGHFLTTDPVLDVDAGNPHTWNRYGFVRGNPLRFSDPTGAYVFDPATLESERQQFRAATATAASGIAGLPAGSAERSMAETALGAYGSEGVENGVVVAFSSLGPGVSGETVNSDYPFDGSSLSFGINSRVTFPRRAASNDLALAVPHEGQHLVNHGALAAALTADVQSCGQGAGAAAGATNLTQYADERSAYGVSVSVARGLGASSVTFNGLEVWNRRRGLRSDQLDRLLAGEPYSVTPTNPGFRLLE